MINPHQIIQSSHIVAARPRSERSILSSLYARARREVGTGGLVDDETTQERMR